jgi:hypothetical protein
MSEHESRTPAPPRLEAFRLPGPRTRLAPARPDRAWMDAFRSRHPYRCLPLLIANAHGWDLLAPFEVWVEWTGGPEIADLRVSSPESVPQEEVEAFASSHFGGGILTFRPGFLFRTPQGWNLHVSGPANRPKKFLHPLTGVVETGWSPYTFTMNWQLLEPGTYLFERDEPFCTLFPVPGEAVAGVTPEIHNIADDPGLARDFAAFGAARSGFLERLAACDPETVAQGWQRHYFTGRLPDGTPAPEHRHRLRPAEPVDRSGTRPALAAPDGARPDEPGAP